MKHLQHITELTALFAGLGLSRVVISPGSRNAPLMQAFTSSSDFKCHSIVDERSAGYVALGMARELGEPVLVLCTSGTAVLNLAPAVAEAYYQGVPLLVISADRPVEPLPSFTNQWIDQEAPYYAWSRGFLNIGADIHHEEELEKQLRQVAGLVEEAWHGNPGPVHLNLVLEEPLYDVLPEERGIGRRMAAAHGMKRTGSSEAFVFPCGKKVMVLAGLASPDEELEKALEILAIQFQVVVVAEHLSNKPSPQFISHPELVLAHALEEELPDLQPDYVIGIDGQVVSKRLKLFLQAIPGLEQEHLHRGALIRLADQLAKSEQICRNINVYSANWKLAETEAMYSAAEKLEELPFSNFRAVYCALRQVPSQSVVHLGNSAAVRYAGLCPPRRELRFYSNRGTSGIDGCVSSAVGAAMVSEALHFLVVGDLSFVYDSNALWNRDFPDKLRILVLNDGEGGIFRLLDGPSRMAFFEEFSLASHPVSLKKLSEAFGRKHHRVAENGDLKKALEALFGTGEGVAILEADTRKSENSRIFKEFFE